MEKETAVNHMLEEMAYPKSALEQAKADILYLMNDIYPNRHNTLEDIKRYACVIYETPADKKLLEQAWEELVKDGKINP